MIWIQAFLLQLVSTDSQTQIHAVDQDTVHNVFSCSKPFTPVFPVALNAPSEQSRICSSLFQDLLNLRHWSCGRQSQSQSHGSLACCDHFILTTTLNIHQQWTIKEKLFYETSWEECISKWTEWSVDHIYGQIYNHLCEYLMRLWSPFTSN